MRKNNSVNNPSEKVFRSRRREAAFWEKNMDQVWAKGKPVKAKASKNLSETINIRLDPKTIKEVRYEAEKRGIGPTQLIRMWIKERISLGARPPATV